MQQYINYVQTRAGAAVSGASVLVKTYPGAVVATIYSDDGVTETTNPLTTDANGKFSFYAADGRYSLTISKTGVITQTTLDDILLADPDDDDPEQDAADVIFVQSGIGAGDRTAEKKMRDIVSVMDFEVSSGVLVAGDGTQDDVVGIQAAIDAVETAGGGAVYIPNPTFGVGSEINLKNGVDLWCDGTLKALAGFSDSQIVTTDSASNYQHGTVQGLRLDGNGLNIKGLYIRDAQTSFFSDIFVSNCLNTGIHAAAGYEVFINRFQIIGKATGMTADAPGLLDAAGDSHFADGVVTLYPRGFSATAGNSHFTRCHPWAVYTSGSTPMLHGFYVSSEGNRFTDCNPDSPDLTNRGSAASESNGGYGFYFTSTAITNVVTNARMIVASHANAPTSDLYFAHVAGSYNSFVNCEIDDNSGSAMAGSIQFASATKARETNVIGGNLDAYTGVNHKFWLNDMYSTFTPDLNFGGTEISTQGGTYFSGRRTGFAYRFGPMLHFWIHIRISATGTATGDVTISGLPTALLNVGNSDLFPVEIQFTNNVINAYGRILVNETQIRCYLVSTGAAVQHSDIGANQEMYVSGFYPVASQP